MCIVFRYKLKWWLFDISTSFATMNFQFLLSTTIIRSSSLAPSSSSPQSSSTSSSLSELLNKCQFLWITTKPVSLQWQVARVARLLCSTEWWMLLLSNRRRILKTGEDCKCFVDWRWNTMNADDDAASSVADCCRLDTITCHGTDGLSWYRWLVTVQKAWRDHVSHCRWHDTTTCQSTAGMTRPHVDAQMTWCGHITVHMA